jgi:hypothetical protein
MNLRERLLSQQRTPPKSVEIKGETFHLAKPTLVQFDAIRKAGQLSQKGDIGNLAAMQAKAVLLLVIDPTTGKPLFEAADEAALLQAEHGSLIAELASAAMQHLGAEGENQKNG